MASISKAQREKVIKRAQGLCEYCQTSQAIVIEMEIDHIVPESAGGETLLANLCLACISCNHFKGDSQSDVDPESGQVAAFFNPRTQVWNEHFQWNETGMA